jgi:hypothetical protein
MSESSRNDQRTTIERLQNALARNRVPIATQIPSESTGRPSRTTAYDLAALLRSRTSGFTSARPSGIGDDRLIILDFGKHWVKAGYAGEHQPRVVLRRKESIVETLSYLFTQSLLIDPRGKHLIICEPVLLPALEKLQFMSEGFQTFGLASIRWAPSSVMTILTNGFPHGIIIDIGSTETVVAPVFEYRSLNTFVHCLPLGGNQVLNRLKLLIKKYGVIFECRETLTAKKDNIFLSSESTPSAVSNFLRRWTAASEIELSNSNSPSGSNHEAWIKSILMAYPGYEVTDWSNHILNILWKPSVLEDILCRFCFVGDPDEARDIISGANTSYSKFYGAEELDPCKTTSSVVLPCIFQIPSKGQPHLLVIPGSIRDQVYDVIFDGFSDGDCVGLPRALAETILALPCDTRTECGKNVVIDGGFSRIPGLITRLQQEYQRTILEHNRFAPIRNVSLAWSTPGNGLFSCGAWTGGALRVLDVCFLSKFSCTKLIDYSSFTCRIIANDFFHP